MTDNMVERVAEAIQKAPWGDEGGAHYDMAKAAIAEMQPVTTIDDAYIQASELAEKNNSIVSFEHEGVLYTVRTHRLGAKIRRQEAMMAEMADALSDDLYFMRMLEQGIKPEDLSAVKHGELRRARVSGEAILTKYNKMMGVESE